MGVVHSDYFVSEHIDEADVGERSALVLVCKINVFIDCVIPVDIRVLEGVGLPQFLYRGILSIVMQNIDYVV